MIFCPDEEAKKLDHLASGKPFQPRLIFVSEIETYPLLGNCVFTDEET
jgi:hypothetical protein